MPLFAKKTRQKYSPSSIPPPTSRVSQRPAASVNSRLTSQVAGFIWRFSSHRRSNHSIGDKSHQSELGTKRALFTRKIKYPQAEEKRIRLLCLCSAVSICFAILSGDKRSSASSH